MKNPQPRQVMLATIQSPKKKIARSPSGKNQANAQNRTGNVMKNVVSHFIDCCSLTKKAEPTPTRDVNRDSGTAMTNGGWLRRLVRALVNHNSKSMLRVMSANS